VKGVNLSPFPGQYYDPETGLHYNYFRYYNPQTGRYITPDPIGLEGGINLFAYTDNNPVNRVDPEGLSFLDWLKEGYRKLQEKMEQDEKKLMDPNPKLSEEFQKAHPDMPDPQELQELVLGMTLSMGGASGLTKGAKFCKASRGLDDILENKQIFNRFLRRKHPSNRPYSLEDSRKIWDKMKGSGLDPKIHPGHSGGQWTGPHINAEGTNIHIPVDPRFKP
jgi:RHS repeat-associated protein